MGLNEVSFAAVWVDGLVGCSYQHRLDMVRADWNDDLLRGGICDQHANQDFASKSSVASCEVFAYQRLAVCFFERDLKGLYRRWESWGTGFTPVRGEMFMERGATPPPAPFEGAE